MTEVRIAPTNDRTVVGVMTEFAFMGEQVPPGRVHGPPRTSETVWRDTGRAAPQAARVSLDRELSGARRRRRPLRRGHPAPAWGWGRLRLTDR